VGLPQVLDVAEMRFDRHIIAFDFKNKEREQRLALVISDGFQVPPLALPALIRD